MLRLVRGYRYGRHVYGYRPIDVVDIECITNQLTTDTAKEKANRARYANVLRFIENYRKFGHRTADLDPLNLGQKEYPVLP
jgi:2-oxoglutarate dehydrogenase complex dehydrogenase (E1) component-like enzyme